MKFFLVREGSKIEKDSCMSLSVDKNVVSFDNINTTFSIFWGGNYHNMKTPQRLRFEEKYWRRILFIFAKSSRVSIVFLIITSSSPSSIYGIEIS